MSASGWRWGGLRGGTDPGRHDTDGVWRPRHPGRVHVSDADPLQRPVIDAGATAALAGRSTLTEEEAAAFEIERRTELNRDLQNLEVRAPGVRYQSRAEGGVGGYNEFWYERGIELTRDRRTSLVVDPPDGRIPFRDAYLAASRVRTLNIRNGFADSYTDRSLADRCLMGFNAGPPMVSSAYNNNVHILQTPDHVVILNEMVHNARVIPLDGRPLTGLRQYAGESRGRWTARRWWSRRVISCVRRAWGARVGIPVSWSGSGASTPTR